MKKEPKKKEPRPYRLQRAKFDACFHSVREIAVRMGKELISKSEESWQSKKKKLKHLYVIDLKLKRDAQRDYHVIGEIEYLARGAERQAISQQIYRACFHGDRKKWCYLNFTKPMVGWIEQLPDSEILCERVRRTKKFDSVEYTTYVRLPSRKRVDRETIDIAEYLQKIPRLAS